MGVFEMKISVFTFVALGLVSSPSWAEDCKPEVKVKTLSPDSGHIVAMEVVPCPLNKRNKFEEIVDPATGKVVGWKIIFSNLSESGDYK